MDKEKIEKILNFENNLIYKCSSYLTYVSSNIQTNIINIFKNKD